MAAQAWSNQLRSGDLIARYGGEEFGILLPKCSPENAANIVERLRRVVPDRQTFSAGIALWDGQEKPEETVARADAALYLAKQNGRDRSEFALPPAPVEEAGIDSVKVAGSAASGRLRSAA
jgi:diguanylate cyclase